MSDMELSRFYEALNKAEEKFFSVITSDKLGLLMRCAINELDWCCYNSRHTETPTAEMDEYIYILKLGVVRFVKLSLDLNPSFAVPVVTTVRTPSLALGVLEIASALGMIQHGRRVAQTVAQGIGCISQISPNSFNIVLPRDIVDEEYYEREVLRHFNRESQRLFSDIRRTSTWQNAESEVDKLLSELVYVYEKNFIGYDADPLLDQHFFSLAYHEVMMHEGFDTFNYKLKFGGIRFQNYILGLAYIISLFKRHERFAETLVMKEPSVKLENVLTISSDTEGFVESIRDAVNYFGSVFEDFEEVTVSQATTIFNVLACSRSNTTLIDAPGAPIPTMVRCSEEGFIRCLVGALDQPVRYLLESLRFHYPRDYDRNQQGRERSMQLAARRVLDQAIKGLEYRDNIVLRLSGQALTDVDLVVLEKKSGIVLLCQLKFQELYGTDLHAKRVRGDRLRKEVKKWFDAVDKWSAATDSLNIRSALQLPKSFPEPVVYRLVISKHFSHPLRSVVYGERDFHCNWPLFVNSNMVLGRDSSDPGIIDLLEITKNIQETLRLPTYESEPNTRWQVSDLIFTTTQETS